MVLESDSEALEDQWSDLIAVAEFVAEQMVDEAKFAEVNRQLRLLDAVRAVQSTIRQAHKVKLVMGWPE